MRFGKRLQPWFDRVDALALRERLLLTAASVMVLFVLVDNLWLQPVLRAQQRTEERITDLQNRLQALGQNPRLLGYAAGDGSTEDRRRQLETLQTELAELDARIGRQAGAGLQPSQALERLLGEHPGLAMHSLAADVEPLDGAADDGLSRYRFSLVLTGAYADMVNYLRRLERAPENFYWEQAAFHASAFPEGEGRLELYTLRVTP